MSTISVKVGPESNTSDLQMTALIDQKDGRTAILLAAERLFAEYGLHGASLRQISEAAGQKNTSAIQYHFGSRDRLVEAVFALRMAVINPRRQAALDRVKAQGRLGDLRALVSVMVWPMAEELRPRAEGNHYVQFLYRSSRERNLAVQLAPPDLMTAWTEMVAHLFTAIRYLPDDIAASRILLAGEQCITCLAGFEADNLGQSAGLDFHVETLIDMIAAGIAAPVSDATLKAKEGLKAMR